MESLNLRRPGDFPGIRILTRLLRRVDMEEKADTAEMADEPAPAGTVDTVVPMAAETARRCRCKSYNARYGDHSLRDRVHRDGRGIRMRRLRSNDNGDGSNRCSNDRDGRSTRRNDECCIRGNRDRGGNTQ